MAKKLVIGNHKQAEKGGSMVVMWKIFCTFARFFTLLSVIFYDTYYKNHRTE